MVELMAEKEQLPDYFVSHVSTLLVASNDWLMRAVVGREHTAILGLPVSALRGQDAPKRGKRL